MPVTWVLCDLYRPDLALAPDLPEDICLSQRVEGERYGLVGR